MSCVIALNADAGARAQTPDSSAPAARRVSRSKEALYRQVLQDVIDNWINVFGFSDEARAPRKVLSDYIRRKMVFSFEQPLRSRIFAMEMMRGAPVMRPMLMTAKRRTGKATAVIHPIQFNPSRR
jgi:hypothetical protein